MAEHNIYKDISERTGGEIYLGVVGPVRTGKSTFIRKFMEELVIPNIENQYDLQRAKDEMPQSGSGKTVMTTEPKFIPDVAVNVNLSDNSAMKVKLIDCVGYPIPDASGQTENGEARMVMTPWSTEPRPFAEAAETGTKKVICDHSTIVIMVTTDGSICGIPRESYTDAEERVIRELKEQGKPFAVILNSADPQAEESVNLAYELENRYEVPVALVNCTDIDAEDINRIMELILEEFPVKEINIELPEWTFALSDDHWLKTLLLHDIMTCASNVQKIRDISSAFSALENDQYIESVKTDSIDMGNGSANISASLDPALYYKILSELTGFEIDGEESMIRLLRSLSEVKREYDRMESALRDVNEKGYGIVFPDIKKLKLNEPEIIKQPGGYGVRLKASAPSIHMIKADIETEINPMIGTERQSEDLVNYLVSQQKDHPEEIWNTNMFGKTLYELVDEGIKAKLSHMPQDAREKLSETLGRVYNEGSGGLVCIIL